MAITYQSAGAVGLNTAGTGTYTTAYPASIGSTDYLVLIAGIKPSSPDTGGTISTPAGFTLVTSLLYGGGYGASGGANIGDTSIYGFVKAAAGTESGNLTITNASADQAWGQILRLSHNGTGWAAATGATGSDTTSGNVSITFGSDPGIAGGDYVVAAFCAASNLATYSAHALSATGVTFGTVTEISEPASASGNHIGGFIARAPVSSGPSSAAPVLTATTGGTTTNARGPGIIIRIRETGAPAVTLAGQPKFIGQAIKGGAYY